MKAYVLADFLVECTSMDDKLKEAPINLTIEPIDTKMIWILHVDGASNLQGSGSRLILIYLEGVVTKYAFCFLLKVTNSQSKYEALLARQNLAKEIKIKHLRIFNNSQLMVVKSLVSTRVESQ